MSDESTDGTECDDGLENPMRFMTLQRPVRQIVRRVIDETVVPDDIVMAVEGDETLTHLAEAWQSLRFADYNRDTNLLERQVKEQAEKRAIELIDAAGLREKRL